MPTTRPRYTITDTGIVEHQLDDAQRQWPEIENRKDLLLRLAEAGHKALQLRETEVETSNRRTRQRRALERLPTLVEVESLLADRAWE
jgi:hypothetical protein